MCVCVCMSVCVCVCVCVCILTLFPLKSDNALVLMHGGARVCVCVCVCVGVCGDVRTYVCHIQTKKMFLKYRFYAFDVISRL